MADKKRKTTESSKTPAKKRKVEATKKTPSSAKKAKTPTPKKVTSTKVKKPEPKSKEKKTPKTSKTPTKSAKTPVKGNKSAKTPVKKATPKPAPKKNDKKTKLADKTVTRTKLEKAKVTGIKAKLDKAKALKAKAAASKAKLKTTKSAAKPKAVLKAPVKPKPKVAVKAAPEKKGKTPAKVPEKTPAKTKEAKKPEEKKKDAPKKTEEKKETPKAKVADKKQKATESVTKRKTVDEDESADAPRKRRMITPNKKFADFELDVPSKRTITPNKKYADYETDASSKRVSELRAFIQDKKKSPTAETPSTSEKTTKKKTATPSVSTKKPEKATKETPAREIKVFKPSDMKPAEKLMKKLQKKLEKEAKSASTPKPVESREKAKIKITKVVTYNKPLSSDEKEMRALKATPKTKTVSAVKTVTPGDNAKTPKQTSAKPNVTKAAKATPKATPKSKAPEKQPPKPKKIKELPRAERPIQAKFTSQKNVKSKDDNDQLNCWITGIGVFPSGEIIMVDMTNRKIKLFSKDFDFLSQVKLDTIPQDISVSPVNVSDAYFTKPFSKEGIQKVTMSDGKLTLKESFWTNGTNRGITCTKNGILTSVQDGRYHDLDINHFKIDLLDYEGKVLQSVSTDSNGSRLFKLPLYFTVNNTGKQMIVADCIKHFSYVVSVDMTGKIKFKYEGMSGNLVTPRGLTIDDEDNIYVTEWERHNVYVLSPAGKRLQVLFTHQELLEEGLDGLNKPYQLCFYKEGDVKKLIVSQEGCNTVKIFQMFKKGPETEESKQAAAKAVTEKKDMPNGEASPAKRKPATPKKNGSQTKTFTTIAATEVKKTTTGEPVTEKVEQIAEPEEAVAEKVPEQELSEKVDKVEVPSNDVIENTTAETVEEKHVETAVPKEVPDAAEEEKEESPPVLNPEFGDDFGTVENETEEISSVQDAINSLNDSKEDQIIHETDAVESDVNLESGAGINHESEVDANVGSEAVSNQVQVEIYEQVGVPNVETLDTQQEIAENMNVQEEVQVPVEMDVQQVELMNSQYEQVLIPEEEIITTQSVDTEIQSVPMESVAHETIIIQQDVNQMNPHHYEKIETVTMNNNDASNLIQTETVQYVTDVDMPESYATNIAQSEIVTTEMPEEIVTMVTETV
ncbi:uncharacterized protein LOC128552118 [Mercenaria mercenaria]|uniref:uncharacterized protein LOC128552118 n=1 Tax=Mercenaria mercenaria TaxID=6596 RepID=UPI00234F17B9|nr:uncharacterized protein LOC128552118 [Mercenaria mercenaria]